MPLIKSIYVIFVGVCVVYTYYIVLLIFSSLFSSQLSFFIFIFIYVISFQSRFSKLTIILALRGVLNCLIQILKWCCRARCHQSWCFHESSSSFKSTCTFSMPLEACFISIEVFSCISMFHCLVIALDPMYLYLKVPYHIGGQSSYPISSLVFNPLYRVCCFRLQALGNTLLTFNRCVCML